MVEAAASPASLGPAPSLRVQSDVVRGPVGSLEALLRLPGEPRGAAVVAHPHPLFGGTMHTKVVHRAAKVLESRFGLAVLRFNFRGVGASEGTHDGGRGEVLDVVAAVRHVRSLVPDGPLVLSGFSFGSLCALRAIPLLPREDRPDAVLVMGIPLDRWNESEAPSTVPVAWIQGEEDQFGSGERARDVASRVPFALTVVPGSDHFFTDRLDAFEEAAGAALDLVLPP